MLAESQGDLQYQHKARQKFTQETKFTHIRKEKTTDDNSKT